MKSSAVLLAPALLAAAASAAHAAPGPDVAATIVPPPLTAVYATGRYQVTVANGGNQNAGAVSLTIALPATHTSPQVHVMGNLGAWSAGCTRTGTTLACNLGQIKRGKSVTVFFDVALPESAAPLTFIATAATAGDTNPANDADRHDATLAYFDVTAGPAGLATNEHCTGTGLTAWFECTRFPGSTSQHTAELHADGTITFPGEDPAYGGSWSLGGATPLARSELTMTYTENGTPIGTFFGRGVSSSCFEGLTTFIPGPYVAPYKVCF
jgi:hypothetical protein